ncbi:MAG: sulfatase [Candidatus Daviesbacteria bacterium]|nr:sulfatase [Candidatus Daviesbacteria bacterium]
MKKIVFKSALITFLSLLIPLTVFVYFEKKQNIPPSAVCKDCNIILISMTNLRFDHMSINGYFRPTTPNLDELARASLKFDNAFSHSSWTLPESISIYTGLYPYQHGVMNRYDGSKLSADTVTLVDVLKQNGYITAAFTGGFDYHPEFGLTDRFNVYKECRRSQQSASYPRQGGPVAAEGPSQYGEFSCTIPQALDWLKLNSQQKFFLHIQGFDDHCPFSYQDQLLYDQDYQGQVDFSDCLWTFDKSNPVLKNGKPYYPVYSTKTNGKDSVLLSEEDITHLIALYDTAITITDQKIGSFLEELKIMGLDKNTIIIFTSEHGDMFGKHGRFMRGGPLRGTFYDDVLHIPLFIKIPNVSAKNISGLVEQIDLAPTITNLVGLPIFSPEGQSLLPLIFQNKDLKQYVFAGAKFNPDPNNAYFSKKTIVETIRSKEWKLIEETVFDKNTPSKTIELYDIVKDKEELNNLAYTKKDVLQTLQKQLKGWSERINQ